MPTSLEQLAQWIQKKNQIEADIAHLIGRPAQIGHAGEYIASVIFDIQMAPSASHKASDGLFRSGPLAGRTVSIKWYGKQDFMMGAATSIPRRWWEGAEIYPANSFKGYSLSQAQMGMLALFSSKTAAK